MCVAFNSKTLVFPVERLKNILLYSSIDDMLLDCRRFGIPCDDISNTCRFSKDCFNDNALIVSTATATVTYLIYLKFYRQNQDMKHL